MSKIIAFVLAVALMLVFVSCGNTGTTDTTTGTPQETQNTQNSETSEEQTEKPENTTGSENTSGEETTASEETTESPEMPEEIADTLPEIIKQIYEIYPSNFPTWENEVDLTNADILKASLGIESGDLVAEAYLSDGMLTTQAYSLSVVRVKNAADAETIAKEMQKNANPGKWVCVWAEAVQIAVSGDLIVMAMTSEEEAQGLIDAFKTLCGGELDITLEQ